jgi:hypothetical protein
VGERGRVRRCGGGRLRCLLRAEWEEDGRGFVGMREGEDDCWGCLSGAWFMSCTSRWIKNESSDG